MMQRTGTPRALIVGGGRDLGLALAERGLTEYPVVPTIIQRRGQTAVTDIAGYPPMVERADVRYTFEIDQAMERLGRGYPHAPIEDYQYLFYLPGMFSSKPFIGQDPVEYRAATDHGLLGLMNVVHAFNRYASTAYQLVVPIAYLPDLSADSRAAMEGKAAFVRGLHAELMAGRRPGAGFTATMVRITRRMDTRSAMGTPTGLPPAFVARRIWEQLSPPGEDLTGLCTEIEI